MSQLADAVHCAYDKGYEQGKIDSVGHCEECKSNGECAIKSLMMAEWDIDEYYCACFDKIDAQEESQNE